MIPIYDSNRARSTPYVNITLIVANFLVFFYELSVEGRRGEGGLNDFITRWGAVPNAISDALSEGRFFSQATLGLITSQFLLPLAVVIAGVSVWWKRR